MILNFRKIVTFHGRSQKSNLFENSISRERNIRFG
jgi:hypothetical protein